MKIQYNWYVGIDVSKLTIDVAVQNLEQTDVSHSKFLNNENGHNDMLCWVKEITSNKLLHCLFCLEHTGVYCLPLTYFLSKRGLNYTLQNGLQVKRTTGIYHRGKTDKTDASMLAKYANEKSKQIKLNQPPIDCVIKLKALLSFRERLVKSKVALQNASKELASFTDKKVHLLIETETKDEVSSIKSSLKKIDKEILKVINSDADVKKTFDLMLSVTGVGLQIASYIIVYTNNFTVFSNWRKFACYCGLAPFEYSSGTSIRRRTRTSKMANRKLKAIIGNGATSALLVDKELLAYYNRKLKEGKHKLLIINNIKNKMISRIFATVKRGTPFVRLNQYAS